MSCWLTFLFRACRRRCRLARNTLIFCIPLLTYWHGCCATVLDNQQVMSQSTEIVFWHAMAGTIGEEIRVLAEEFNQSQNQFKIKPVYKGNYLETLTSFAAAFRAGQAPAIVQVFEVGTALMLSPKGVIKPVFELMQEQKLSLPEQDFTPSVRAFYSENHRLMAMPFNLSVPVLYYNMDILSRVGYNKNNLPNTWADMEIAAQRLKKAGYPCTYTSAYPGWILLESFMALHDLSLTKNAPKLVSHLKRLRRWSELHYFRYAGRVDEATLLFTSSTCPIFSHSSGIYQSLGSMVPFQVEVSAMPLDTEISATRHTHVIGGAALWAVSGLSQEQYQGIAQFFVFLAQPEIQKRWHEHTGYLPLGVDGVYANIVHPELSFVRADFVAKRPMQINHSIPQHQLRIVHDEILEALFAGLFHENEALSQLQSRSRYLSDRFIRNTSS